VSRQGDAGWPGPKPGGADQTVSGRFAARKLEVQCLHGLARFEALARALAGALRAWGQTCTALAGAVEEAAARPSKGA
jgi:hypothetical protein